MCCADGRTRIDPTIVFAATVVGKLQIWIGSGSGAVRVVGGVEGGWVEELHVGRGAGSRERETSDGVDETHLVGVWRIVLRRFRGLQSPSEGSL